MPINPNIALGVQQQQPVNYLAQMGQAMALRAAQQETEGYEGVKSAITGGMDASDPRMLQFGKRGIEAFKAAGEGRVKQQDALSKAYTNSRQALSLVRSPEDLLTYSISQFSDPLIGPSLKASGLTPESVAANLQKELATSGFENVLKKSAMGLDGWFKDQTSRRNQDVASGPAYGQLKLAQERAARDQAELERVRGIVNSGVTPPATAPVTPMGGGASSSIFVNPASSNVLADQVAPLTATQAPVNSLLNPPAGQSGAVSVTNRADEIKQQLTLLSKEVGPVANQAMERLIKEYNVLSPAGKIEKDANNNLITVNERTGRAEPVLGPDGKPIKGASPYESAFTGAVGKSQAERNEKVVTAAQAASANIQKIDSAIELLKTGDTTTGLGAELRTNIDRARALFAGDIKAGKKVADTQILDALLGSDVFSMIQSLGIGARGLDTPAERDYLRQVMTGTIQMDNKALVRLSEIRRNIEVRAIEKYNTQLEKGELNKFFETQGIKPEKIEVPKMVGGSNTVSVGGNTYTFPNAEAAAKFKKDAGIK
jgi:hypothetical protein